jgi:hypothetical protein
MSQHLRFVPPGVDFDPRPANELVRREATPLAANDEVHPVAGWRSPFSGYVRMLAPPGGIIVFYKDQDRSLFLTILRVFA